jgi:hypothetical protein
MTMTPTVECRNSHRSGDTCTREDQHHGDHMLVDGSGQILRRWRGGRPRWAPPRQKVAGVARNVYAE